MPGDFQYRTDAGVGAACDSEGDQQMLLLRRGRAASRPASSLDIEVAIDLGPVQGRHHRGSSEPWRPPIEVIETDAALEVRAEIGGVAPEKIELLVSEDELSIRGERSVSRSAGHRRYHESRIRYGPFEAMIRLPFPVKGDAAVAEYIDGVLSIVLPRQQATTVLARDGGSALDAQRGER